MNNARNMIHMPELSHCPYTGRGVGIAFLDTGIFPHRDFSEPFLRIAALSADGSSLTTITATAHISAVLPPAAALPAAGATAALRRAAV